MLTSGAEAAMNSHDGDLYTLKNDHKSHLPEKSDLAPDKYTPKRISTEVDEVAFIFGFSAAGAIFFYKVFFIPPDPKCFEMLLYPFIRFSPTPAFYVYNQIILK